MKKHHPFVVSLRAGSEARTRGVGLRHWLPADLAAASLDVTVWTRQRRPHYWQLRVHEEAP